jgi:antitoxin HicB
MNTYSYPIELTSDVDGGFVITFPDFPEAITQGETIQDCLVEAKDCLEEAVAGRIEDDEAIPQPSKPTKYTVSVDVTRFGFKDKHVF